MFPAIILNNKKDTTNSLKSEHILNKCNLREKPL